MISKQNTRNINFRSTLNEIIFGTDTPAGKLFDVILIWSIVLSVLTVVLESVTAIREMFGPVLNGLEWFFTILFTFEYLLRIFSIKKPTRYIISFFGIVDLLAILPTYMSLIIPGSHYLLNIRILRLLRIFRVFKLSAYLSEAKIITTALKASRRKISVFLLAVITIVVIIGTCMYVIEGEKNGFTNIPTGIYWAIVTLTTVGYGDLAPQSPFGKALASCIMILGYGIIAVPTGIVTAEFSNIASTRTSNQICPECNAEDHEPNAVYCKFCGNKL